MSRLNRVLVELRWDAERRAIALAMACGSRDHESANVGLREASVSTARVGLRPPWTSHDRL
jgi:hypothetical protein